MGGECNTQGRDEKFLQRFRWENIKIKDRLKDEGAN